MNYSNLPIRNLNAWLLLPAILLLQACSGGSGGGASERENSVGENGSGGFVYSGPAPASDEIQSFKISFYDNLVLQERCGSCHTGGGAGPTAFVDRSDVNFAWREASRVVNLNDPASSRVVERVGSGHHCWLGDNQTASCRTTMMGYIERWAQGAQSSVSQVQLTPTPPVSPSGSKAFPPYSSGLANELTVSSPAGALYLLQQYCSACHSDTATSPQAPFFASANTELAYAAMRTKVDLTNVANSRLVQRLRNDFHNCWTASCADDAQAMQDAISRFTDSLPVTQVDADLVTSMAQVLGEHGIVASSGGRYETDIIAKWEFREGTGNSVADTSGVQPEAPMTLSGDYEWFGGWGVSFTNGKAQAAVSGSSKLMEKLTATGEYTIEAWVAPNNVSQEDAWILGYAGGVMSRNLLLSQSLYNYDFFNRSSVTDDNGAGEPALSTDDDAQVAQATLQHVVLSFDPVNGRRIYVNGEFTDDLDTAGGGILNTWNSSFSLVVGNSIGMDRPWAGVVRMLAIHNRRLTDAQIAQNYEVGVGQKFFLLFSVAEILDREGECHSIESGQRTNYCYVVFEVSQFDANSYLFNAPFFISLNQNFNPDGIVLRGIRIGINGKLPETGQGFVNINTSIDLNNYAVDGQRLSTIGTVIVLENGPEQDSFFLAFDEIDGQFDATTPEVGAAFSYNLTGAPAPDIGMRTFEEINATFSAITGVPVNNSAVQTTFTQVKQALPTIADFAAYLSSHQMAVTQLAIVYCDALVASPSLRNNLFNNPSSGVFGTPAHLVSDADWSNRIIYPLVDKALGTGLGSQPDRTLVHNELLELITAEQDLKPYVFVGGSYVSQPDGDWDGLARCGIGGACSVGRTEEVVKAVCAAVLGSGAVLMQ